MVTSSNPSKRFFVLGGTGGTGQALIAQALERGYAVTAFVRSPEKLGPTRDRLTVVRGDPGNVAELRAALPAHEVVLSALGPPGPGPSTIVSDCARSTVAAMRDVGVRRLLIVGVAVLFEYGIVAGILRRTLLRNVAQDSAAMERIVVASGLDWTIARPPRLTNGPLTRRYGAEDDRMPDTGRLPAMASMSRADVAHFLLEEVERPAHIHRIVGMASLAAPVTRDAGQMTETLPKA